MFIDCFEALPACWRDGLGQAPAERTACGRGNRPAANGVHLVAETGLAGFDPVATWLRTQFGSARSVAIILPRLAERPADIATLVPYYLRSVKGAGHVPAGAGRSRGILVAGKPRGAARGG